MSLSVPEKRTEHWHVKIKSSLKKRALVFIAENSIKGQSDFNEIAIKYYLDLQDRKQETNVEMN